MKLSHRLAQYDLDDAYWANWGYEYAWARRRVIQIAKRFYEETMSGKGK